MSVINSEISVAFEKLDDTEILNQFLNFNQKSIETKISEKNAFYKALNGLFREERDFKIKRINHENSHLNFKIVGGNSTLLFIDKLIETLLNKTQCQQMVIIADDSQTGTTSLRVWNGKHYFEYDTGNSEEYDNLISDAYCEGRLLDIALELSSKEQKLIIAPDGKEKINIRQITQNRLTVFFNRKNHLKLDNIASITEKASQHGWFIRCYKQSGEKIEDVSATSLMWFCCMGTKNPKCNLDKINYLKDLEQLIIDDEIATIRIGCDYEFSIPEHCSKEIKELMKKCYGFYNNNVINVTSLQSKELLSIFTQLLGYEIGAVFQNDKENEYWVIK